MFSSSHTPQKRVLVTDDNPASEKLPLFHIKNAEAEVVIADQATAACLRDEIDLVLMGMDMSKMPVVMDTWPSHWVLQSWVT